MIRPCIAIILRFVVTCAPEIISHEVKGQYNPVTTDPKTSDSRLTQVLVIIFSFYVHAWNKYKSFLFFFFKFALFYFIILYWFCHSSTWICRRCTRAPHPESPSHLPPHTISLGHPSAPAPSIQYHASNLDWRFISYMILYMFQCHSPKSSYPLPLLQSPKDCFIHLCLFCCLTYRVIVTVFLNSI